MTTKSDTDLTNPALTKRRLYVPVGMMALLSIITVAPLFFGQEMPVIAFVGFLPMVVLFQAIAMKAMHSEIDALRKRVELLEAD